MEAGDVEVRVEPATLAVAPGSAGTVTVTVRNGGAEPATFAVAVTGAVADWTWVAPAQLTVPAGGEGTARLSV